MTRLAIPALVVAMLTTGAGAVLAQKAGGSVVVIMDGSGSMWGTLPGGRGAKFELAREALRERLPALEKSVNLGLVTFGRSCGGVQIARPVARMKTSELLAPLAKFNPRGKGPLTDALRRTAQSIDPQTRSSIVLIHDGTDNCRQDVCAEAKRIAKSHPTLSINMVSLGMDEEDMLSMTCVVESTGGEAYLAGDAKGVGVAISQAVKVAIRQATQGRESVSDAAEPTDKPLPAKKTGPPRLRVVATMGKDTGVVSDKVQWRVFKPDLDGKLVLDVVEQRFTAPIDPGRYTVEARLGLARASLQVDVGKIGETVANVNLNAGRLNVRAPRRQQAASPPVVIDGADPNAAPDSAIETAPPALAMEPGGVVLVYRRNEAPSGENADLPVWISEQSNAQTVLPAGDYRIVGINGTTRQHQEVALKAGARQSVDILQRTGRLQLSAEVSSEDQATPTRGFLDDIVYHVAVDDPDADNGRREVVRSVAPRPVFDLPAGTYYVTARLGLASSEKRVAVGAGDSIELALPLAVGIINVSTDLKGVAQSADLPLMYRVFRPQLGGGETEDTGQKFEQVAMSGARSNKFVLPAGPYRVTAELGARNIKGVQDLQVGAGSIQDVKLTLDAGSVSLKLSDRLAQAYGQSYWEVTDANGHTVWRTNQSTPKGLLAPGRYKVTCEKQNRTYSGIFDLASGETRVLELGRN